MHFLSSIEHSAFPTWVRTTDSIFGYYGFLFLHTVGLAIVVGIGTVIDLRLLGFVRRLPIAPLEEFFPILWTGFWMNVVSGAILFAQDATARFTNPLFGVKIGLVALAAGTTIAIRREVFRRATVDSGVSVRGKLLAAASLILWFSATAAGRLMAYVDDASALASSVVSAYR